MQVGLIHAAVFDDQVQPLAQGVEQGILLRLGQAIGGFPVEVGGAIDDFALGGVVDGLDRGGGWLGWWCLVFFTILKPMIRSGQVVWEARLLIAKSAVDHVLG